MQFQLKGQPFIQLNNLLKVTNLVGSGGEAKIRILNGEVQLNNEVITILRKKLVVGDAIAFNGKDITITE